MALTLVTMNEDSFAAKTFHPSQTLSIPRIERGGTSGGIVGRLPLVGRAALVARIPTRCDGEVARAHSRAHIDIANCLRLAT